MPQDDDFATELRGEMRITDADIPKSTLAAAGILWTVLAAIGGWTLKIVSDMRVDLSGQAQAIVAINARVDRIERDVDRSQDDIRELQRTRTK